MNDVALLFCESAGGQAVTLSTPNGFAAVTNSPQSTGAGTAGTRLQRVLGAGHVHHHGRPGRRRSRRPRLLPDPHLPRRHRCWQPVGCHRRRREDLTVTVTGVTTTDAEHARRSDRRARRRLGGCGIQWADQCEPDGHHRAVGRRNDLGQRRWLRHLGRRHAEAAATGNTTASVTTASVHPFLQSRCGRQTPCSRINVPAGTLANDVMIASITYRPCSNYEWGRLHDDLDAARGLGSGQYRDRPDHGRRHRRLWQSALRLPACGDGSGARELHLDVRRATRACRCCRRHHQLFRRRYRRIAIVAEAGPTDSLRHQSRRPQHPPWGRHGGDGWSPAIPQTRPRPGRRRQCPPS